MAAELATIKGNRDRLVKENKALQVVEEKNRRLSLEVDRLTMALAAASGVERQVAGARGVADGSQFEKRLTEVRQEKDALQKNLKRMRRTRQKYGRRTRSCPKCTTTYGSTTPHCKVRSIRSEPIRMSKTNRMREKGTTSSLSYKRRAGTSTTWRPTRKRCSSTTNDWNPRSTRCRSV